MMTINNRVAGVVFAPFWLLDRMTEDINRLNEPRDLFMKNLAHLNGSWLRYCLYILEQLFVYVVGSLGLRLAGFAGLLLVLRRQKLSPAVVFLLSAALISFTIPLLFNQSSKAYDIIQFTPYFTLTMVLLSILVVSWLFSYFKNVTFKIALIIFLFALNYLLVRPELEQRFRPSGELVSFSQQQLAAVTYIKSHSSPEAIFLLYPSDFNENYLWFSSLTERRTVYSGSRFADQVGDDSQRLRRLVLQAFSGETVNFRFNYVYLLKKDPVDSAKIITAYRLKTVFENKEVIIAKRG